MKTACKVQCPQCPFRHNSMPGWLGNYTPESIMQSLWRGIPFFCHTKIDYEREGWLDKAKRNGVVCLGSLAFSDKLCVPTRPDAYETTDATVLKLREENRGRTDIDTMDVRTFMAWHGEKDHDANMHTFATNLKSPQSITS